ncbi:hypothetical protein EDD16DRAFT_64318 [Pisolithus croceorrhizus]|nr:hypothetical protein EDD16DRAFT_64318 [Pisolithus croceorrhizus]KAI6122991.1 hypothetical protein EV401DRAFT_1310377 [Pisolithus croceorrhizus]
MDELAIVRAELARLEEDEQRFVRQLSDTRAAASALRKRIDELIRTRGPLIQRLPVEILSLIFHLALCGTNPSRKEILARVSRRWKNIILEQPSFWSTFTIHSGEDIDRTREHLKRSREAPLHITIHEGFFGPNSRDQLDLLISNASRWRSLTVIAVVRRVVTPTMRQSILDCIGAIELPPLRCVKLDLGRSTFPTVLTPTNVPVLEHLEIGNFHHNLRSISGTPFSERIPVLTLVTLSLSGDLLPYSLQPNSVHFPVLEMLNVSLKEGAPFFEAIVTPKLKSVHYTSTAELGDPPSDVFSTLEDKFSSVEWLSFTLGPGDLDTWDARALCRAFPNVCHVEFYSASPLSAFFGPCEGIDGSRTPAGYWTSLESVVFRGFDPDRRLETPFGETNAFLEWLVA